MRSLLIIILLALSGVGMAQRIVPLDNDADKIFKPEYRDTLDRIVDFAIENRCFPGCQIYATINGKVVINKAYGYFTYPDTDPYILEWKRQDSLSRFHSIERFAVTSVHDGQGMVGPVERDFSSIDRQAPEKNMHKVQCSDIYDIASLSKVSSTTVMVMKAVERHLMATARPLGDYLKNPYGNDAAVLKVSIRSMLEHRSGIKSYVPITRFNNQVWGWKINCRTLNMEFDSSRADEISRASFNELFCTDYDNGVADRRVADGVWMRNNYQDSLYRFFFEQRVNKRKRYVYSDINMIYLQWAAENALKEKADKFMQENFYGPLGMETTGYKPLERFGKERIAPTEAHQWTGRMLQGDVHDPSCAFLGGVAGNAGIFSSAQDLGILFQMLLNRGVYNGKRYLEASTIDRFTSKQPNTSRGLGFDMAPSKFAASKASSKTYGHTGFTGTCAWADPENKIVIVFLSNRVHPSQSNLKINELAIRKKICNAIYDGCGINE